MYISLNTIKSLEFSYYDYSRAENLYLYDQIKKLNVRKVSEKSVLLEAEFPPEYYSYRKNQITTLNINTETNNASFSCGCTQAYGGKYICCHCLALMMYANEIDFNNLPFNYEKKRKELSNNRRDFYDSLQKKARKEVAIVKTNNLLEKDPTVDVYKAIEVGNDEPLNIYVNVEYDYRRENLQLGFKIGNKKTYIVKSLQNFLNAIDQRKVVSYGKFLSFRHSEEAFEPESRVAINLMRNLYALQDYYSGNKLPIDINSIGYIYSALKDYPKQLTNIDVQDSNVPYEFTVTKDEQDYIITDENSHDETYLTNDGIYSLKKNGTLFSLTCNELPDNKEIKTILKILQADGQIVVSKQSIEPFFYRYVKPLKGKIEFVGYPEIEDQSEKSIQLKGWMSEQGLIEFQLLCDYKDGILKNPQVDEGIYSQQVSRVMNTIKEYADEKSNQKDRYVLDGDKKKTKDFMLNILPLINKDIDVYLSEELLNYGKKQRYSIKVGLTYHNDLLHFNVSSVDIPADELSNVLRAYQRKQKFYRLKDGDTISLYSDELQELDELMSKYGLTAKDLKKKDIALNPYRAFALDKEKEKNLTIERTKQFNQFLENFANVNDDNFKIVDKYQDILRDYQKFGVEWMHHLKKLNFGGILADDMGLGKTLEVISLLESEKVGLSIVICPASLILNWDDELKKFNSSLKALPIYGSKAHRESLISNIKDYDLVITSYDYMRNDIEKYEGIEFDTIILDEAQYIKNLKTKNATSVKQLKGKHHFALTGTPIENSLAELWSIFDFLMPGYLFTYSYFKTNYENAIINEDSAIDKQRLKDMVSPFILRRNKKDVLTELPDKVEHTIIIDFNEEERKIYLANLIQVNKHLQEELKSENFDQIELLAMITKLRQICGDRRLVYDNIKEPSSKVNGCLELIQTLKQNNKKVLLFSTFASALELIETELQKNSISYLKLTGATKKEDRKMMVDSFQNGDVDVFLISLKAGGTGLNLTKAEAVIHFDPWWNVSAQNQATDRAYRIGQHNNVQIYKMIIKDSIEERMLVLQEKKKQLSDTFIEGNEGKVMKMQKEDFEELLSYK